EAMSPKTPMTSPAPLATAVMTTSTGARAPRRAPRGPCDTGRSLSSVSATSAPAAARKVPVARSPVRPCIQRPTSAQRADASRLDQHAAQGLHLLEHDAGAARDTGERLLGHHDRH